MALPELNRQAQERIDQALREGSRVTFHVTKVKARRWNWILTMRYASLNSATGEETLKKVFLQNSKDREHLELIREHLESRVQSPRDV